MTEYKLSCSDCGVRAYLESIGEAISQMHCPGCGRLLSPDEDYLSGNSSRLEGNDD